MTPTPATTGTPNISLAGGLLLAAAWVLDVPRCDVPGQFRRPGQVTYRATPRTAGPGTPLRWPLDLSRFQGNETTHRGDLPAAVRAGRRVSYPRLHIGSQN